MRQINITLVDEGVDKHIVDLKQKLNLSWKRFLIKLVEHYNQTVEKSVEK